jgi:ubiquinone/menaquinone biosynthesis C-methylase UbiE
VGNYERERKSRDYYEGRAPIYDWSNRIAALLRGTSGLRERRKAVRRLNIKAGDRVLEVSAGTGTNLPLIHRSVGPNGQIVALDISPAMLARCQAKAAGHGFDADLVVGEAAHLPMGEDTFDAVFHHGGIAEFGDRKGAIDEMWRVAKPGGRVVICDVGRPTDRPLSLVNRLLIRFQPEYDRPPPVNLLPKDAEDVQLSWFHRGGWYLIELSKPN